MSLFLIVYFDINISNVNGGLVMRKWIFYILTILLSLVFASISIADVLLKDDFENEAKYKENWIPTAGWSLKEAEINKKATTVLDVNGGEIGLSVKNDFGDFEMEADFQVVTGYLGFIIRAKDTNNLYMLQMTTAESAVTPNNLRWHTKVASTWTALPEPYLFELNKGIWYHIRIEAIGDKIKVYVAKAEEGRSKLKLIAKEWTPPSGGFKAGSIGFRDAGGENGQVDNVIVATPGGIDKFFAVQPAAMLPVAWGMLKR
jgi:hypothetical protein